MLKVGILGASGYTGYELVRLLRGHPEVKIAALGAHSNAGQYMADLFVGAATWTDLPRLEKTDDLPLDQLDAIFCALPHGQSAVTVAELYALPNLRAIIDLSNDYRLTDYSGYAGMEEGHPRPDINAEAVYGLTEIHRKQIAEARLIANPGCYPTSILLALIPLLKAGLIDPNFIVANSASGTSGAGRGASVGQLHSEVSESFKAYGLGTHRHLLEIQEQAGQVASLERQIVFNPHLLPMNRGILSTLTLLGDARAAQDCLERAYADEAFVHVAPMGSAISTKSVRGTNLCRMAVHMGANADQFILTSAIDNVVKGAAGQAVQNMNVALGYDEGLGLSHLTVLEP